MTSKKLIFSTVFLVLSGASQGASNPSLSNSVNQSELQQGSATQVTQRYIVLYKSDAKQSAMVMNTPAKQVQALGGKVIRSLSSINGVAAHLSDKQVAALRSSENVKLVEQDPQRTLQHKGLYTYGVDMIQAPQVSDLLAANQSICIIDTGYDSSHEDLPSGVTVTGKVINELSGSVNLGGWNEDSYGHGTHVAGTIAALGNNLGYVGILPSNLARFHHVKVVHDKRYWRFWGSDVISAVNECQAAGARVINMSLAGTSPSEAERAVMQSAYDNGALLVGAAGNLGSNEYFYPASYDSVISVGAIDKEKHAWAFTQKNQQIELVAPGVEVISTVPNHGYRALDGTSIAAPHVSGVAALVWSQFPQCSNKDIRHALQKSALDLGETARDEIYGFGLVQAYAAVNWLHNNGCSQPKSCKDILEAGASRGDGYYSIDFDGNEGPLPSMQVYCDMTSDSGGWTAITPELAFTLNGGNLTSIGNAPTQSGFNGFRPYSSSVNIIFSIAYDIPLPFSVAEFYLANYQLMGMTDNPFDIGSLNPYLTWQSNNNSSWGDVGIGSAIDEGPKYRFSSDYNVELNAGQSIQKSSAILQFDQPTTSLRIAWKEYGWGTPEGIYPFYRGRIFVR